jgi:allantoin racemase
MKIVYIVPGIMDLEEAGRREKILQDWANHDTFVQVAVAQEGPLSIECMYEEYLSIAGAAHVVMQKEAEGFDVAIIGCGGDPGVDAFRELTTRMLVLGPGEVSFHLAALLGHRFSVLKTNSDRFFSSVEMAFKAGVSEKLADIIAVNVPVLEMHSNREKMLDIIVKAAKKSIEEKHVDTLTIGCMTMAFMELDKDLNKALGIPVINPAKTSLKIAEALRTCGLMHSKVAFPQPAKLHQGKVKDYRDLYVGRPNE